MVTKNWTTQPRKAQLSMDKIHKVNIGNYVSEKFEGSPPLTPRCFAALNAAVVLVLFQILLYYLMVSCTTISNELYVNA